MTSTQHSRNGARNSLEGAAELLNEIRNILDQALVKAEERIQQCLAAEAEQDEKARSS
jgi:hypothetical protein